MKTTSMAFIALIIFLSGCKTQQKTSVSSNDDVYYPKSATSVQTASESAVTADLSAAQDLVSDTATTGKPGSSTFTEDYNDYSYAARIKRFNHPEEGRGYYDEIYTRQDNYDTIVSTSPDVNIYLGSGYDSYWGPSFSFGFSYGWGYPYSGWGYPYYGWGYPYYGYYYPYYDWYYPWWGYPYYYPNYYYGYYDGYYNGYWDGYYGYPYDPYPYSNYYYGKRNMTTSGGYSTAEINRDNSEQNTQDLKSRNDRSESTIRNERTTSLPPAYDRSTASSETIQENITREGKSSVENNSAMVPSTRSETNLANAQKEQYRYTRTSDKQSSGYQRSAGQITQSDKPVPRYTRPQNTTVQPRTNNSQSYSSPAYRQAKSSQEYINPRPQSSRSSSATQQNPPKSTYSAPSSTERQYTSPSGTSSNSRQYSTPSQNQRRTYSSPSRSNTSPSYSSPSRSSSSDYSAPSRSNPSNYSAPSRSTTPSYSAPSRSSSPSYSAPSRSGNSGSGSSSGSSSGGRRR